MKKFLFFPGEDGGGDTGVTSGTGTTDDPYELTSVTIRPGYQIQQGDTLSQLAMRFGVTISDLMEWNSEIKDMNKIYAGDFLTIPPFARTAVPKSQYQYSSSNNSRPRTNIPLSPLSPNSQLGTKNISNWRELLSNQLDWMKNNLSSTVPSYTKTNNQNSNSATRKSASVPNDLHWNLLDLQMVHSALKSLASSNGNVYAFSKSFTVESGTIATFSEGIAVDPAGHVALFSSKGGVAKSLQFLSDGFSSGVGVGVSGGLYSFSGTDLRKVFGESNSTSYSEDFIPGVNAGLTFEKDALGNKQGWSLQGGFGIGISALPFTYSQTDSNTDGIILAAAEYKLLNEALKKEDLQNENYVQQYNTQLLHDAPNDGMVPGFWKSIEPKVTVEQDSVNPNLYQVKVKGKLVFDLTGIGQSQGLQDEVMNTEGDYSFPILFFNDHWESQIYNLTH